MVTSNINYMTIYNEILYKRVLYIELKSTTHYKSKE